MYYYLYDSFLNDKKYEKVLARIESRLTDLGINGKIGRLNILKNPNELVEDEIKSGAKTVVVVGNDKTVIQILNALAGNKAVLGFIPLGSDNKLSEVLGIPYGEEACDLLSARRVKKIDLGKANNQYFLSNLQIKSNKVELEFEKGYKVIPVKNNEITIYNLAGPEIMSQSKFIKPQDGLLETLVEPQKVNLPKFLNILSKPKKFKEVGKRSIFPTKKLTIKSLDSEPVSVLLDGIKVLKTPVKVEVALKKLTVIVGKDRMF